MVCKSGGECEIRTHGPFLIGGFQVRWIKPLSQLANDWSTRQDSNLRYPAPKAGDLTVLAYA